MQYCTVLVRYQWVILNIYNQFFLIFCYVTLCAVWYTIKTLHIYTYYLLCRRSTFVLKPTSSSYHHNSSVISLTQYSIPFYYQLTLYLSKYSTWRDTGRTLVFGIRIVLACWGLLRIKMLLGSIPGRKICTVHRYVHGGWSSWNTPFKLQVLLPGH